MMKLLSVITIILSICGLMQARPMDSTGAMNYLKSFGYLATDDYQTGDDVRDAVMNFQQMANLEMTGKLNDATMRMMEKPRCGVEDMIGSTIMGTDMNDINNSMFMPRHKRYAIQDRKWSKNDLTYKFMSFSDDLTIEEQKAAIQRSFTHWSDVTPLTFTEITDGTPDIVIEFAIDDHSDGPNAGFDGPGGVLAHAYFPENGDAHFDDAERFTVHSYDGINLDFVATHEFGHSLGLAHSSVPGALMRPFYQGYNPDFVLPEDDVAGIQSLYGDPDVTHPDDPNANGNNGDGMKVIPGVPDICNTTFDAIFMDLYQTTYVTKDDYIWLIRDVGVADDYPKKIDDVFPGLPGKVTAVFTSPSTQKTYFFKGRRVWRFTDHDLDEGYPKRTDDSGLPRDPSAAFVWSGDNKIYIFKGSRYYIWDEYTEKIIPGANRRIRKHWHGLPSKIDAAFKWKNGRTYFFKDDEYWRYNDMGFKVDDEYPKTASVWWLGCEGLVIAGRVVDTN
ncbi:matrix metalloproteinase-19-like [Glandiceps talaboti]